MSSRCTASGVDTHAAARSELVAPVVGRRGTCGPAPTLTAATLPPPAAAAAAAGASCLQCELTSAGWPGR